VAVTAVAVMMVLAEIEQIEQVAQGWTVLRHVGVIYMRRTRLSRGWLGFLYPSSGEVSCDMRADSPVYFLGNGSLVE
jgi:hypothetical protein